MEINWHVKCRRLATNVGANLPYWGSIGQIDELAIYDFVLSQEQINFRYNLSSGTESMPLAE